MRSLALVLRMLLPALLVAPGAVATTADEPAPTPTATAAPEAGDATATDVPDPFGLGERLALISYLLDHHETVAPDTSLEELRTRYAAVAHPPSADATAERDGLALTLWRTYGEQAPPQATAAQLRGLLALHAALDPEPTADVSHLSGAPPTASRPSPPPPPTHRREAPAAALASERSLPAPPDLATGAEMVLISPEQSPIMLVVMSPDLRHSMDRALARWPAADRLAAGISRTVILLGHSDGLHLARVRSDQDRSLSAHLRRNRGYYATCAGTMDSQPVDFVVMCGCNERGANQEVELRDGLGYRPLHRVFTVPGLLDRTDLLAAAIIAIGSTPANAAPFAARFDLSPAELAQPGARPAGCYGLVSEDALQLQAPLHRFLYEHGQLRAVADP